MRKTAAKRCVIVSDSGQGSRPWLPVNPGWSFEWHTSLDRPLRPLPDVVVVELEALDIARFRRDWEPLLTSKYIPTLWIGNPDESLTSQQVGYCYCFSDVTPAALVESQLNHFVDLAGSQKAWDDVRLAKQRKIRQWHRQFKDLLTQKENALQSAINDFLTTDFDPVINQINEQIIQLHENRAEIPRRFRELLSTMRHCGQRLADLLILIRDIQKGVVEEYGFGEEYVNLNKAHFSDGLPPQHL
jgi:hypothetical protein